MMIGEGPPSSGQDMAWHGGEGGREGGWRHLSLVALGWVSELVAHAFEVAGDVEEVFGVGVEVMKDGGLAHAHLQLYRRVANRNRR